MVVPVLEPTKCPHFFAPKVLTRFFFGEKMNTYSSEMPPREAGSFGVKYQAYW